VEPANDPDFGLGGSVFTKNIARGKRLASRIDTGMVFINHPTWTAADLPFGAISAQPSPGMRHTERAIISSSSV
jgi:acyl-CoA reductase-like NAD-dependent aldehyde dehydrogenase